MKIGSVAHNNRRKGFEVRTRSGAFWFPYAKLDVRPLAGDGVASVRVDRDLGGEGFTYALGSGGIGTVHIDQVLEYNEDPSYMRDQLVYELTLEAQKRVASSGLSKREIIRRLGTSAAQLYRLLDQTNYRKSVDRLLVLLSILDCRVDFAFRSKIA